MHLGEIVLKTSNVVKWQPEWFAQWWSCLLRTTDFQPIRYAYLVNVKLRD